MIRFLLTLFAFALASPAYGSVCSVFDQPLTSQSVARYVSAAKAGYPVRYRGFMDRVRIVISPAVEDNLSFVQGRDGDQIVIPASFPKRNCLLTLAGLFYQEGLRSGQRIDPAVLFPCPRGGSGATCIVQVVDAIDRASDKEASAQVKRGFPSLTLMAEMSFLYAIAHELGHAVEAHARAGPIPEDYDAELAADLQALYPVAAGVVVVSSDGALFTGRVLAEAVEGAGRTSDRASHEATICRAIRANAMREKMVMPLMRIVAWAGSSSPLAAAMQVPPNARLIDLPLPAVKVPCNTRLPAEVMQTTADLDRLSATVASLPPPFQLTDAQLGLLLHADMRSPIGLTLRDSLYGNVAPIRAMTLRGNLFASARPEDREQFLRRMDKIGREIDLTDMFGHSYVQYLMLKSVGSFTMAPRGSSFAVEAQALGRNLDLAASYGVMNEPGLRFLAFGKLMAGDCRGGFAAILAADAERRYLQNRLQAMLDRYELRVPGDTPGVQYLVKLAREWQAKGGNPPPQVCRKLQNDFAGDIKREYGWTD